MWILAGLSLYFVLITIVVTYERNFLGEFVEQLESLHRYEERHVALHMQISHAVGTANENYFSPDIEGSSRVLNLEIDPIVGNLYRLLPLYAMLLDDIKALEANRDQLASRPSRAALAEVRSTLHRLVLHLDQVATDLRLRKQTLLADYRRAYNRVTLEWLFLVLLGMMILGGLGMVFFRFLARDIEMVRTRAIDIVRGYRGAPLPITRGDEMGALMEAVNVMQRELQEHETQLELGRQQQFHKEKMAAIGSLAAAVAHEINNPLSAIVGIADNIAGEATHRQCEAHGASCRPRMILDQARRVIQITRQIGEFSVPQSPEPELADLNGMVRSTCSFIGFDRRLRNIKLEQTLDSRLPAVMVVADHIVQILMNLLINAADALEGRSDPPPQLRVSTGLDGLWVFVKVEDNGVGISPANLSKVFDEHFTTKPPGRGAGLGLSLCRKLITEAGGRIELVSREDEGTSATILLPVPPIGNIAENSRIMIG